MGSSIDRTNKSALDANLVNGITSDAPKMKDNNDTLYNYVDGLNQADSDHAGAAVLAHPDNSVTTAKLANGAVSTAKIADSAVTAAKVADGSLTSAKFVSGALNNDTQNGLRITALETSKADQTDVDIISSIANGQRQLITNKAIIDSMLSIARSKVNYDDTAGSIFTEDFTDLSNWVLDPTPGMQVSGNKLYSTGTGSGTNGGNHSYVLASSDNLRAVFKLNIPTGDPGGNVIIGVSKDAAGAAPTASAANAFGLIFSGDNAATQQWDSGTASNTPENVTPSAGDYIVAVIVDSVYISVVAVKTDGNVEMSARRARSGFDVNNLYIFNSDTRALSGMSINFVSARKGLASITPRTFGEGQAKTEQWTGDGSQSWKVYLPEGYDSRIPRSVAICFHGHGSSETAWSGGSDTNYPLIQRALTNAGYIVVSCSYNNSYTTWGNGTSTNAYYQAYRFVRDNYAIAGVVIFANSMGGIESLNAIAENKIPCVAWAGTSATYDLQNNFDNPLFKDAIKDAYGIAADYSDYASKTAGRDPALKDASAFRGLPMWMAAASDDTYVSKTNNVDALYSKVSNVSMEAVKVDVASGGHGFDVTPYLSDIVNFFNKYINS